MLNRRTLFGGLLGLFGVGSVYAGNNKSLTFINVGRHNKTVILPKDNIEWLENIIHYFKSKDCGRIMIVDTEGNYIEGPLVQDKIITNNCKIDIKSYSMKFDKDFIIKEFYVVDKFARALEGNCSNYEVKKCTDITFISVINIPKMPFINCSSKQTGPTPLD